jgi:UDP-hydrolysing UDP-N-acetyl-D-glucosamine 2-epimerase
MLKENKIVTFFTGNRSEFGLLSSVISSVKEHPYLEYKLIVSGSHLSSEFGYTVKEVEEFGFDKLEKILSPSILKDPTDIPKAIGENVGTFAQYLSLQKTDFFVIYGDRFETFAAAIAASQSGIATIHLEGGDITEGGTLDDSVRHAISKLCHLHFPTNQNAHDRLLAMGEEPWRVTLAGLPSIDQLKRGRYTTWDKLKSDYRISPTLPIVLFTQHPVPSSTIKVEEQIRPSLGALIKIAKENVQIFITYPNNDSGGDIIISEIEKLACNVPNISIIPSFGQLNYHGMLALTKNPRIKVCIVGNSSSGIKETPYFGVPTVDIGTRQTGRLRSTNVINVGYQQHEIYSAIKQCLEDDKFRKVCANCENPYGDGETGKIVADVLAKLPTDQKLLRKRMTI